jgi:hypothetical protein
LASATPPPSGIRQPRGDRLPQLHESLALPLLVVQHLAERFDRIEGRARKLRRVAALRDRRGHVLEEERDAELPLGVVVALALQSAPPLLVHVVAPPAVQLPMHRSKLLRDERVALQAGDCDGNLRHCGACSAPTAPRGGSTANSARRARRSSRCGGGGGSSLGARCPAPRDGTIARPAPTRQQKLRLALQQRKQRRSVGAAQCRRSCLDCHGHAWLVFGNFNFFCQPS